MDRQFYLDLAARGLRMPVGTDLVLREKPDHDAILLDGRRLGQVMEEAAHRYRTPLAFHLMDLVVEKDAMLHALGVPAEQADTSHFSALPDDAMLASLRESTRRPLTPRMQANTDAIAYVAQHTQLVPCGMSIGPFSLTTKLLADPITPVYMAGMGVGADEDPEVRMVERVLEMSMLVIERSLLAQIEAGAKAILVAEPAANKAYFSPNQLSGGGDVFDRYAMAYNRRIRSLLEQSGVDLIFHCCGELVDEMVVRFGSLDPAVLSLGSSRILWDDSRLLPKNVVLYGNLPTKRFYSDELVTADQVRQLTQDLIDRMRQTGHPFILGSECDILSVPGCEHTIRNKVSAMMGFPAGQ